jgi:hypothetical protein
VCAIGPISGLFCSWRAFPRRSGRRIVPAVDAGDHGVLQILGDVVYASRRATLLYPARKIRGEWLHRKLQRRLRDECLNVEWFTSLEEVRRGLALWRDHYNHRRPHSALDDWPPAVFAGLHGIQEKRFALFDANQTSGKPRQGFASPAEAALDRPRRLPEDIQYQGEALLGIAHSLDSLLSLRSDFQARKTGSGRP